MADIARTVKEVETATKKLEKQQNELKTAQRAIEREITRLHSLEGDLKERTARDEAKLKEVQTELETAQIRREELEATSTDLTRENHRLEGERDGLISEIAKLEAALQEKKDGIDAELEAYELNKKTTIKERLLGLNQQVLDEEAKLKTTRDAIQQATTQLVELQTVYTDEQNELAQLKLANQHERNQIEKVASDLAVEKDRLEKEVNELKLERDQASVTAEKAREQHEKFLNYEREAKKALETKDRQLQKKAAEVEQQSQFLANQRSFLPKL